MLAVFKGEPTPETPTQSITAANSESTPVVLPLHEANPYKQGFRFGYDAFMKQTGQYIPQTSVSYTLSDPEPVFDPSSPEFQKGYTDGYHRATELEKCPRNAY